MQLTKNFFLKEFILSPTAVRMGIDNYPGPGEIAALEALSLNVLQPLRSWYGHSIRVASGFRSPALNSYIGGANKSQHKKGEAADIDTVTDNAKLFNYIKNNLPFDQIIWEFGDDENPDWIHVSYRADGNNRKEVLKAYRDEYGVHYVSFT